jgi:aromatic ring-opening dioxygenase LigB subunit
MLKNLFKNCLRLIFSCIPLTFLEPISRIVFCREHFGFIILKNMTLLKFILIFLTVCCNFKAEISTKMSYVQEHTHCRRGM